MSFEFFVKEAWNGIRRSGIMSIVSLVIVTVSLVIFGIFILAILNMQNIVGSLSSKMEIVAYVENDTDDYTANEIQLEIAKIDGVESAKYIPKSLSWENFKKNFEGRLDLEEIVKDNPLPNSFLIRVKSVDLISAIAKKISNINSIDEVRYSGALADRFNNIVSGVKTAGFILVTLLIFATLLIIVNTIRLTVISRQADIYIMKLVGATNSFIKWPFLIEGLLIGLLGSAFAFIILKFSYDIVISRLQNALPFLSLITGGPKLFWIYTSIFGIGIFLGMIGGYISVKAALKEKI